MESVHRPSESALSLPESKHTMQQSQSTPPFSNGFWDKDPDSTKARATYFRAVPIPVFLVLAFIIWGVLPIYWVSMWRALQHMHNLNGWIVDLDGGEIGQVVTQTFLGTNGPPTQITWSVRPLGESPRNDAEFEHALVDEQAWVIIAINANASNSLNQAISSINASYNGSLAVTVWGNEARSANAYRLIHEQIVSTMQLLDDNYATQRATQLGTSNNLSSLLSTAPGSVTNPLGYTTVNVRPFAVQIVTVVNFVGLIYLTIVAFVTSMINYTNITTGTGLFARLKFSHLMILRLSYTFITYFVLSTFYALLSFAFGAPFTRWRGASGFVLYWMMAWCTMLALGLAIEAMVTLLTTRLIPFFLILWIVANVSVSYYPIPMLPGVFRYGYASPFYNLSRTVSTICFNTKNEMGLNFGVQLSWIALSICTITIFQWFVSRKYLKDWEKRQDGEHTHKNSV